MSRSSGAEGPTTEGTGPETAGGVGPDDTPPSETLRREIEDTREALGDTVEALVQKTDVKGQALAKVDERKEQLHQLQENAKAKARSAVDQARERSSPIGGVVAAVLGVIGLAWLVRRRTRRDRRRKR